MHLQNLTGASQENPQVIYWSYSQSENGAWKMLNKARKVFGETKKRGSEPDLIIVTETSIFFIEAKLSSGNELKSSKNRKKYETGGKNWCSKVFRSDYAPVAIRVET